jgi:hypothetical protein
MIEPLRYNFHLIHEISARLPEVQHMFRFLSLTRVVVGVSMLVFTSQARAQQRGAEQTAQPAHQNLKVLAPDTPQPQLLQTMQGFAQALGVQCGYCHASAPAPEGGRGFGAVGGRGRGAAPQLDFASDEKPAKKAAREMMLIVRDLNAKVPAAVSRSAGATTSVACITCHRGVAIPRQLSDILTQTAAANGTPAAIAHYKELRKQFFGAQAYDFSETSLVTIAQRASTPDEAIAWLQLNLDYFPFSSRTYAALAQAQQKRNDRDGALKSLTRATELDPQNAQLARQLAQLKDAK